jgi:type IV secretion system protein VirB10
MNNVSEQTIQGLDDEDRAMPSVNARKGPGAAAKLLLVLVPLLALLLLALWGYRMFNPSSASAPEPKKVVDARSSTVPNRTFKLTDGPVEDAAPPIPGSGDVPAVDPAAPVLPGQADGPMTSTDHEEAAKPPRKLDKSGSGLMVANDSPPMDASQGPASGQGGAQQPGIAASEKGGGPLSGMLTGTATPGERAGMLPDRTYLLTKGSFIDCGIRGRIDSTVPGAIACTVTRDIYSANGKLVLVERGSVVEGEYQANLRAGMSRIFVLWTRLTTPSGVFVNLDSPGADPLGGGGLPGHVNTHFWKRFGGAMMLSVVDDLSSWATRNRSTGGNQISFGSTSEAANDMASEALRSSINIPPTLYKNQGDRVGIYIMRDLDFSGVYAIQAVP